jgi:hypothetical protein
MHAAQYVFCVTFRAQSIGPTDAFDRIVEGHDPLQLFVRDRASQVTHGLLDIFDTVLLEQVVADAPVDPTTCVHICIVRDISRHALSACLRLGSVPAGLIHVICAAIHDESPQLVLPDGRRALAMSLGVQRFG